ncbi:MAG: hypothetical protein HYZ20_07535 [Burkholderiales bacterium]|nr:hypothetical protein [Burkholderiales bacterium]
MLGEKLYDVTGKVTGQRVLSGAAPGEVVLEVSFQGTGKVRGIDTLESGTYTCRMKPSGVLEGIGQGLSMTADGESVTWQGTGIGKPTGKGMGASWRGAIYYCTTSQKLAHLNTVASVFEWDVDEHGNTLARTFEWK